MEEMGSKRLHSMEEEDRLSLLPEGVIGLILSRLPIKDAAKTSVLSSRWKSRWARIPELVFDDELGNKSPPLAVNSQSSSWELDKIISHVLLQHTGPINKFVITNKKLDARTWNGPWITYLSRVSLEKLLLNFSPGVWCKTPSSLFSCQELVQLHLGYCHVIDPPPTFGGFRHLKQLELHSCLLSRGGLEKLISSSPSLDKLVLTSVDQNIYRLHIAAPKLRHLELIGTLDLQDVSFAANSLARATISFPRNIAGKGQLLANRSYSNLLQFFGQLPHIAKLCVEGNLLKCWSTDVLLEKLPSPCLHLTSLFFEIDFECVKEMSTVLCLLRSCPNLRKLIFLARLGEQRDVDAEPDFRQLSDSPCPLQKLQCAGFIGISGTGLGLGLIETVLMNSPSLLRMVVVGSALTTSPEGLKLLKMLLEMKRASPNSRIIHREVNDLIRDGIAATMAP